jgi:hypothetical protein
MSGKRRVSGNGMLAGRFGTCPYRGALLSLLIAWAAMPRTHPICGDLKVTAYAGAHPGCGDLKVIASVARGGRGGR